MGEEELKNFDEYFVNVVQIGRILAKFDETILETIGITVNWIDWYAYTAHFPYDMNVGDNLINHLVKHGKFAKVVSVMEKLQPNTAFKQIEEEEAVAT
jgi:hypothetical protein